MNEIMKANVLSFVDEMEHAKGIRHLFGMKIMKAIFCLLIYR
jgi:hypothetical protein